MIPIATTLENIDRKRSMCRQIEKLLSEIKQRQTNGGLIEPCISCLNFCLSEKKMAELNIERGLAHINIIESINSFEPQIYTL